MELELLLEHTLQQELQKRDISFTITDDQGNALYPIPNWSLEDFPPDHPLGYKLTLVARFPPPQPGVESINIDVSYMGQSFLIESVPIR